MRKFICIFFVLFFLISIPVKASESSPAPTPDYSDPSTWDIVYSNTNFDRGGSWITGSAFLNADYANGSASVVSFSVQDFIDRYYDRSGDLYFANSVYEVGDTLYFELKPKFNFQGFDITSNPNSFTVNQLNIKPYGLSISIDNTDYFIRDGQSFTFTTTMRSYSRWLIYPLFNGSVEVSKSGLGGSVAPELRIRYAINWDITIRKAPPGYTSSSVSVSDTVLTDTIKQQHQEEVDTANKASNDVTSGVGQVTGLLSSWEIFTMPVKVTNDLVTAISSEGSTGLTFPSVTIMGHQLWPSYTFDLQTIADQFPLLYNSLHVISGIILVSWFIHYLWRKWHIITGDDTPEGS